MSTANQVMVADSCDHAEFIEGDCVSKTARLFPIVPVRLHEENDPIVTFQGLYLRAYGGNLPAIIGDEYGCDGLTGEERHIIALSCIHKLLINAPQYGDGVYVCEIPYAPTTIVDNIHIGRGGAVYREKFDTSKMSVAERLQHRDRYGNLFPILPVFSLGLRPRYRRYDKKTGREDPLSTENVPVEYVHLSGLDLRGLSDPNVRARSFAILTHRVINIGGADLIFPRLERLVDMGNDVANIEELARNGVDVFLTSLTVSRELSNRIHGTRVKIEELRKSTSRRDIARPPEGIYEISDSELGPSFHVVRGCIAQGDYLVVGEKKNAMVLAEINDRLVVSSTKVEVEAAILAGQMVGLLFADTVVDHNESLRTNQPEHVRIAGFDSSFPIYDRTIFKIVMQNGCIDFSKRYCIGFELYLYNNQLYPRAIIVHKSQYDEKLHQTDTYVYGIRNSQMVLCKPEFKLKE